MQRLELHGPANLARMLGTLAPEMGDPEGARLGDVNDRRLDNAFRRIAQAKGLPARGDIFTRMALPPQAGRQPISTS